MTDKLIKRENVHIVQSVKSWQEAVYLSVDPLLKQGYVTDDYPKAILELTEKYGAYYVLAPDIALIHARPEDGVVENQVALTLLKEEVHFGTDSVKPVRLLIALAAKNSNKHLDVMQKIASILMDDDKVEEILAIDNEDDLFNAFVF